MSKFTQSLSMTSNTVAVSEENSLSTRSLNSKTYQEVPGSFKKNYEKKIRVLVKEIEQYVRENSPISSSINRNISGMAISPDQDSLVISADEGFIGVYSIETLKLTHSTSLSIPAVNCLLITSSNYIIVAGISNEIYVLDYPTLEPRTTLFWNNKPNDGEIYSICTSENDSYLYTLGNNK